MPLGSVILYPYGIAAHLPTLNLVLACFLNFLTTKFLFCATSTTVLSSVLKYSSALSLLPL